MISNAQGFHSYPPAEEYIIAPYGFALPICTFLLGIQILLPHIHPTKSVLSSLFIHARLAFLPPFLTLNGLSSLLCTFAPAGPWPGMRSPRPCCHLRPMPPPAPQFKALLSGVLLRLPLPRQPHTSLGGGVVSLELPHISLWFKCLLSPGRL